MAKKDFNKAISGVDAFFSAPAPAEPVAVEEEPTTPPIIPAEPTPTVTPAADTKRHGRDTYVFTLHIPKEWKDILADTAWERRTSVTQLLVGIIGDWLKANHKI